MSVVAREAARPPTVVSCHDCRQGPFIPLGVTSHGTPVKVNAALREADVFLVLSDVKVHYFAGYSNPVKNFVPGVCAYETAEKNHRWALDEQAVFGRHPWHPDARRRHNPVAQDQKEAMDYIVQDRPVYALVTISSDGEMNWARFGLAREVTAEAFLVADKNNMHRIAPTDRLIVSAGGHPGDVDLYIAQRALELTKAAVRDQGEILFLAACPDGVGQAHTLANFYHRLTEPLEDVLKSIEQDYVLYSHKPYRFAQMIKRLQRIWLVSEIEERLVKAMHLFPAQDPQVIIDRWLLEDPDTHITIVDGANKVALWADQPDERVPNQ
jgi:nickel-dependent lactate racemase